MLSFHSGLQTKQVLLDHQLGRVDTVDTVDTVDICARQYHTVLTIVVVDPRNHWLGGDRANVAAASVQRPDMSAVDR